MEKLNDNAVIPGLPLWKLDSVDTLGAAPSGLALRAVGDLYAQTATPEPEQRTPLVAAAHRP